jgi:hydroxyacylglutathione hydrolase
MILKRFYDEKLAQASYLVGCEAQGTAIVIDANRDVEQYIRAAETEDVRITQVTETHIHADFVSGSRELSSRTGAKLLLSDEGDADWKYRFAEHAGATLLRSGDVVRVGKVHLEVRHTPGHTPEHLSFLVTDQAATERPIGIFTGDFVFVGDVGRPDLLERAAGVRHTMEESARRLFRSLQEFKGLPDYLQIWPGHGAGSPCGKALSALPSSTVGYEKLYNPAFQLDREDRFVEWILSGQPEPPEYFAEMKRVNRDGPALLRGFRRPARLTDARLGSVIDAGALVVDTRPATAFGVGHVPGTINIPLAKTFTIWAGWLIPYTDEFYLLVDDRCRDCVDEAVRDLALIGLDRVAGYFGSDAIESWRSARHELQTIRRIGTDELTDMIEEEELQVVDVRGANEWEEGHIPGAVHIPLGYLADRIDELPGDRPIVVHCGTGNRSAIAAALLEANGVDEVYDYHDGFEGWKKAGERVST